MTVTLEEAQARLPELVRNLLPGEILTLTDGEVMVARLVGCRSTSPVGPPGKDGVAAIMGKWPGDETDEEVAAALREMS